MQPAPKVKNPVSLVGVPPRLVKKEVGKNLSEQTQIADGLTSNLKALQLKGLSRSPSKIIRRARSPFSGFDKVESRSGAIVPERKCQ
ncbi:hypothetical protein QT990_07725 [Microcoleus sp. T3_B1]|uniref:hypothetical protein n=1 Tax=Microcoleus sp. T3_B1 TaxID=3055425 RepID=UPI002FD51BAE